MGAVDLDCNPAQKTVPTGVTQVTNPNAHLLCWTASSPSAANTVVVSNQFGSATLRTGAATQLCLPSWSDTAPRSHTPTAPPDLSHFACYTAGYAPGSVPFKFPSSVRVRDQFSSKPVRVNVGAPKLLCLPTTKIVNGQTFPALDPQAHLLCYSVAPAAAKHTVYDQDQFGAGRVQTSKSADLCVPTSKVVVPPTG